MGVGKEEMIAGVGAAEMGVTLTCGPLTSVVDGISSVALAFFFAVLAPAPGFTT